MEYEYLFSWIAVVSGIMLITIAIDFLLMNLIIKYYLSSSSTRSYWDSRSTHLQNNHWVRMLFPYSLLPLSAAFPLLTGINTLWFLSAVPITASIIQIIRQHSDFRADGYRYLPVCLPCGLLLGILFLTNHILYWS